MKSLVRDSVGISVLATLIIISTAFSTYQDKKNIPLVLSSPYQGVAYGKTISKTTIDFPELSGIIFSRTAYNNIGFRIVESNQIEFYQDLDNDSIPDKQSKQLMQYDNWQIINSPAPEHWGKEDSISFRIKVKDLGDKLSFSRCPDYLRKGTFNIRTLTYEIILNDINADGSFDYKDSNQGQNIGFRLVDSKEVTWGRSQFPVQVGENSFVIENMKRDGSQISIKQIDFIIPGVGEYYTPLKIKGTSAKLIDNSNSKYTLYDFWWTGCGICIRNFPKLKSWSDKNKGQISVNGICVDSPDNFDIAREIVSNNGLLWSNSYIETKDPVWLITGAMPEKYKYFQPIYILVDRKGIVRYIHSGPIDLEEVNKIINN